MIYRGHLIRADPFTSMSPCQGMRFKYDEGSTIASYLVAAHSTLIKSLRPVEQYTGLAVSQAEMSVLWPLGGVASRVVKLALNIV